MVELSAANMLESDEISNLALQRNKIEIALKEHMLVGDVWYVIDASWFKLFKFFVGMDVSVNYGDKIHPGPIDNSPILDSESGEMKLGLIDGLDYIAVPNTAWDLLCMWYGVKDKQTTIERKVINVATPPQIEPRLEVYKIELKLYENTESSSPVSFYFSRCDKISKIETFCKKAFRIKPDTSVQLRALFGPNKSFLLDKNKTVQEESLNSDLKVICEILVDEHKSWMSSGSSASKGSRIPMMIPGQGLVFKSVLKSSSPPESRRTPCTPGLSGLANLGNTCFMNSIIQCLSNCRPITKYFLEGNHEREINTSNPLGKSGQIANSFAEVIASIWSGKHSITVPRYFKLQLTHFAPQFAGFRQHDAQELLTFLLDGLHEDLNRVREKPYCQVEETELEVDQVLAQKSWEYFLSRNDSVIIDNFHGMLKSRVVCPDCGRVSIKFDTFSSISLPLPFTYGKTMTITVRFVPYDQVLKECDILITVPKTGYIRDVALELSKTTEVKPDRMVIAEVYQSHFHKFYSMDDPIEYGTEGKTIYMYDLPLEMVEDSSWKYTVVPVALWEVDHSAGNSYKTNFFGIPFLLVLPRGPISRSSFYRKIQERMTRSWSGLFKANFICDSLTVPEGELSGPNYGNDNLFTPVLINAFSHENLKNIPFDSQGVFEVPGNFGRDFIALKIHKQIRKKYFKDSIAYQDTFRGNKSKSGKYSLENCLSLFTTTEKLGENNAWHCPRCNQKKRATKKLDLWKLPNILILHLKRFLFNETRKEKLDLEIEFPMTELDIDHYVINKDKESFIYDLIGVCNHYGSLMCGHYTAFCKNYNDGKWYCFDDSSVYPVSPESVKTQHAYVLFYQRRPPSTI